VHHSLLALTLIFASAVASTQDLLSSCTAIDEDMERLRCYDTVSGRAQLTHARDTADTLEIRYRWEQQLTADATREPLTLQPYQPSYVLFTHLRSFNHAPYRVVDPEDPLDQEEVKLSFSLKTKLADDLFGNNGDVWLAYTQTSYWQVLNTDASSPFRETDHNPEARIAFLTNYRLPGMTLRGINLGMRHDSNGGAGSLSRSWNRLFADIQLAEGGLLLSVRPWVRVFNIGDNPDIEDYYGDFDVRASWEKRNHLFSAMVRNPFDHHYGTELSWSFPITGRLRGLVQWYYGYGENLIDYDHKNNRISVGVLVSDWL
jgi:phospholipase A1